MTSINVCIIEDGPETLETLKAFFEIKGHRVVGFPSAEEFEKKNFSNFKGLYLVDWRLPGKSGVELIKQIRKRDPASPIFILSAMDQKPQIVRGLEAGADDYLTKPFNYDELHVRATNALNKYNLIQGSQEWGIKLLPEFHSFSYENQVIKLTQSEYKIFACLFNKFNMPVSRNELMKNFSEDEDMHIRNIDVHVFTLRRKVGNLGLQIESIHRVGYRLHFLKLE